MNQALMYKDPVDFARFMLTHLTERVDVASISNLGPDPLKVQIGYGSAKGILSLHNVWQSYVRTGDLNQAIDFLNGIIHASTYGQQTENMALDAERIFPSLRPEGYSRQMETGDLLCEGRLPGLDTVFMERKDGFTVLINKELLLANPQWDEKSLIHKAYENLRNRGWSAPQLRLPVPFNTVPGEILVFHTEDDPIELQLLVPQLYRPHLPESFLAAFPARYNALVLRTDADMHSASTAKRFALQTGFKEVVKMAFNKEPWPLSRNIYWITGAKAYRLSGV
jgi:hypothetical protein